MHTKQHMIHLLLIRSNFGCNGMKVFKYVTHDCEPIARKPRPLRLHTHPALSLKKKSPTYVPLFNTIASDYIILNRTVRPSERTVLL